MIRKTLVVLVAAVAAAACSGSSGGSTSQSSGQPTETPSSLITSKSAARTLAAQINLKTADLPSYTASPHQKDSSGTAFDKKLARCLGEPVSSNELASVDSDDFSTGSGLGTKEVSSSVAVEKTTAAVTHDLTVIRSAKALGCFNSVFKALLVKQFTGATVNQLHASLIDVPTPSGAVGAFGIRLKIAATIQGIPVTFYVTIRGAGLGQLELTILDLAFGKPYPDATAERLLGVITARALAKT